MKEIEFNLLTEPWVRVRRSDNTVQEVSLTDALLHAQDYVDLAGEMPTQDAAMLRLLLAVLFTVFSRVNVEGEPEPFEEEDDALARWGDLWQLGHFPEQPLRDYLEQWKDRFWLFHPTHPFWQVPTLSNGIAFDGKKLNGERAESGNKTPLFQNVSKEACEALTYAQAARWLIYQNGYDERGGRPKAGNKPRHGVGWLGQIGFIQAQGENLFETLMLNLTLLQDGQSMWGENLPCWELDVPRSAERTQILCPDNPAQLLTLQSRRLLLHRENDMVDRFYLLGGDFFQRETAAAEQMTIWRNTAKKNEAAVFVPVRHDPAKQFWREFPSVFCKEKNVRKPGVVCWVKTLQRGDLHILDPNRRIHFRISGMQYGDKDFFVNDSFSDSLTFQAGLLDELSCEWQERIVREINNCEKAAQCVGYLAQDIAIAAGNKNENVGGSVRAQFYFRIDRPFRQWLQKIDANQKNYNEMEQSWQAQARNIAEKLGKQMVMEAGNAALKGHRIVVDKGKKTERTILYTSPRAYNIFRARLWEIYPKTES